MNRQGTGTQPLRSASGNVFASQPTSNTRAPSVGNQRIQSGKLGNGSSWGFGMPMGGGAPGLSNPPSRTNTLSNFAQAIGGAPSQNGPLDLSRRKYKSLDLEWDNRGFSVRNVSWGTNQETLNGPSVDISPRAKADGHTDRVVPHAVLASAEMPEPPQPAHEEERTEAEISTNIQHNDLAVQITMTPDSLETQQPAHDEEEVEKELSVDTEHNDSAVQITTTPDSPISCVTNPLEIRDIPDPNPRMRRQHSAQDSVLMHNTDTVYSREFPSLSGGGPQAQNQNAMPQAWNSTNVRQTQTPQPPPTQRIPVQPLAQQREPPNQQQPHAQESSFAFGSGLENQYDGQRSAQSRSESNQHGSADDFPPLGRGMNGDGRHDRAGGLLQTSGFGDNLVGHSFGEDRQGGLGQVNGQSEASGLGSGNIDSLRSPTEAHRTPGGLQESQQLPIRDSRQQQTFGQSNAVQPPQQNQLGGQMVDMPAPTQQQLQQRRRLSEMTENEKWGLPGLLAKLQGQGDGSFSLARGVDLNSLGLDLESTEPIFPTFTTPFADANSRPAIPEFQLPEAYTVTNVPPLHTRMSNFSDETLFAIFYQYTRDVRQEIAAAELYTRDWRWHKELRQWMMKDSSMTQPIRLSERTERGVYVFFDAMNWKRERREFILNYDHLDQRHGPTQPAPV